MINLITIKRQVKKEVNIQVSHCLASRNCQYQWIAGSKIHYNAIFTLDFRSITEDIGESAHVVGSLERVWSNSTFLTEEQLATLPMHRGKMWVFWRCLIGGVLFHSKSYKRVIARNDYSVKFQHLDNMHYVPYMFMLKLKKSARKHYIIIKSVLVICPAITLPLWKYWRKMMSSYPHTEGGQLLTTSLKWRHQTGTVLLYHITCSDNMCVYI